MWWIIGAALTVILAVVIWAATATPTMPTASTTTFDSRRCHNEGAFLVCDGPCAPIGGSTCVTAPVDPNGTTRTTCVNGPFRFPFIRVNPATGQVQTGWGVCLF